MFKFKRSKYNEIIQEIEQICFGHLLCEETDDFWIVWKDKTPVGYCANRYYIEPNVCFLCGAGVLPEARGFGLQKRAIFIREKEAKKLGYKRTISYTLKDNIYSANNLIKCGYLLYIPPTYYGSANSLYFQKFL